MAELTGKTISEFSEATVITDEYLFPARDSGGATRKVPWALTKSRIVSAFFPLSVANGGTGATTESGALSALGGVPIVKIQDAQFTGTGIADLVAAMNRANSSLPNGAFILQIGSTTQANKAALLVSKASAAYAGAFASSYLATLHGAKLRIVNGNWVNE